MFTQESSIKIPLIVLFLSLFILLIFIANSLDISYNESLNYFNNFNELTILTHFSTSIFGESNIALRLPFIVLYILSAILFYKVSNFYIQRNRDQFISLAIFMILPGVLSAALLVNTSIIVIFFTLLYIYLYEKRQKHCYLLLVLFLFLDNSFAIFFISLFFYSLKQKDNTLLVISLALFGLSMQLYGFDSGGKPKGYFLETLAIYASIFSPLVFFYFLYTIYRAGTRGKLDLLWYISATTLVFSLLLSFRQNLDIEEFAPFVVIAIPIMIRTFLNSYRVRLPQFRTKHKIGINIVMVTLIINSTILLFNKPIYLYLENPKKHFANDYHFAKDIANKLKELNIHTIESFDKKLLQRLNFYGIAKGGNQYIFKYKPNKFDHEIKIYSHNKYLYSYYIIQY